MSEIDTNVNDLAAQVKDNSRKVPEPKPCGVIVRLINPKEPRGADIYCENLVFGEEFLLKAGFYLDCDLEMAKAAKRNWEFLEIEKLSEKQEAESLGKDFVDQAEMDATKKVDLSRYTYQQKVKILFKLGGGRYGMKAKEVDKKLAEADKDEIYKAVKKAELPVYLISMF